MVFGEKCKLTFRKKAKDSIQECQENGSLTRNDLIVFKEWASRVRMHGPECVRKEERWRDFEEKDGKYAGYRFFSLGILEKRVVYDVREGEIVIVEIVAVETAYYGMGEKRE